MPSPLPVRTTCPYCGVGCGILAGRDADGAVSIAGDPDHPANQGRLCSKGSALADTLSLEERLLRPVVHGRETGWDEALSAVASGFAETMARHGPDSVAFYVSGQLQTEDYYVANKLMKGWFGTANIDTNSRLCMASSVAGHRRAFGSDTVPGCYEDLDETDLAVVTGSNLAWCHPVLFQRLLAARERRGTKIVVIDPRRTVTAEAADLHLPLAPGSDVALFNGLLAHLREAGAIEHGFVRDHTSGLEAALDCARRTTLAETVRITGLPERLLEEFFRLFAATPRTVTLYSQGVNQSSSGVDKVNAIINCHLLTGRIGKPGTGPFSLTGQPNAMGGREVGGLANALAAHTDIENPRHRALVRSFWDSPAIPQRPGLKAVDLFRAVGDGRIKAVWIMATNPVDSLPDADRVAAALRDCPLVVVSDMARDTDTTRHADILLPAAGWGEKDGTVTNSERRISRQRRFLDPPGETQPDWWIICQIARRMGFSGFDYDSPAEIFDEHCRLTAFLKDGARDLDLSGLAGLGAEGYDSLEPVQWPVTGRDRKESKRFFGSGGFFTGDRRARFAPVSHRPPASATGPDYPLLLNTGRIRDQWHSMTRTGKATRLMAHLAEPFIEIHPRDAARHGLPDVAIARVESSHGSALLQVTVTDAVRPGEAFAPIHWTDRFAARARIGALFPPHVDPISGQPESKATPVRVSPFVARWRGYGLTRERPSPDRDLYWAASPVEGGWQIEFAGTDRPENWEEEAARLLGLRIRPEDLLVFHDPTAGLYRLAAFEGDRLTAALFISAGPVAISRFWAIAQLAATFRPAMRLQAIAGQGGRAMPDKGPILCACLNVGVKEIAAALAGGAGTVEAIGAATRAGTGCGACRAEIRGMIDAYASQAAE
ncbi:molybdopterin-dependent oxidoreductase [Inquilinus sp. CAU 1745]|uniref:molybdopterin-dependent oxidoreductase n=1 Tax=Inquilinus sp. CAU 1745 TaxID=3140369 RepID=UPI00325B0A26